MPRGDRSGPMGAGPMTGRGLGYCAGYPAPGYVADGYGRGPAGYGQHGGGRGWRHRYYATGTPGWARGVQIPAYAPPVGYVAPAAPAPNDEVAALKAQADYLAAALEETRSRLSALESDENG
jgi:hypothetical protein